MRTIHTLSASLIAKIAAGEVIERPAYAVKELVENALDAHATYITIQVEEAGLRKILITDNGEGMSVEDLQESFKSHTTSKISDEEHLIGIKSFGFRGEALASIASISTMTIKSRKENTDFGTAVTLHAGKMINILPIGMPIGTSVTIEGLFSAMPARKNFLKSQQTEFRRILEIISQYAIIFPHIRFFLKHNNRITLDFPPDQSSLERIAVLLSNQTSEELIPVSYEHTHTVISGFISNPQLTNRSTNKQFLYVNKRCIVDPAIMSVVKEAYGSLIDTQTYPICILLLSLPFEMVDVNVHPRKEQVHFVHKELLMEHVYLAVSQALASFHIPSKTYALTLRDNTFSIRGGNTDSYAGKILKEIVLPWQLNTTLLNCSEFLQIHDVYLITQTQNGILLVDQHAAHERILYEQFMEAFKKQNDTQKTFILRNPLQFELSVSDAALLQEWHSVFSALGFAIEHFRESSFLLRSVPLLFQDRKAEGLIAEILDNIHQEMVIKDRDKQTQKMIAYLACRRAIKAGDKLTKDEARNLIDELIITKNNGTCPHGRPTRIEMKTQYLHKLFKRK